ncbi:hypothetical protein H4219_004303 [Mycoemilia scoparia]|uniref:Uncharacterized protein n=1 Tax=Mycoemilia scoparia TaxID=417184 RepID=A0A9W7ZT08_9FUNG|nr:hypothetical protein H4219_004303 [Mycoemilia scoparia]
MHIVGHFKDLDRCKLCDLYQSKTIPPSASLDYEEEDEYCPHCDNHYVIEAKTPKASLGVEGEDIRIDNRMVKDERVKSHIQKSIFVEKDLDFKLG